MSLARFTSWVLLLPIFVTTAGCGGRQQLMPTPNLYTRGTDPFPDVPPALQNNRVEVLYLTDRKPENDNRVHREYGYGRSRSVAYGVCEVQFGDDNVTWPQLVGASRAADRSVSLPVTLVDTRELGRFPPTPQTLVEVPDPQITKGASAATHATTLRAARDQTMAGAEVLLSTALAKTPVKEVYLFVHGYNNSFEYSVSTIAQVWHFLGRRGVPIAYSWPAGRSGLLRGYTYDRESSEFTVFHLKEMLHAIADNPNVEKINLIAHSRGTDVLCSALRELHIEMTAAGKSTREALKLGTIILAAPDMDVDVVIQRLVTARLGRLPERFVLYICRQDEALGISNWLFGGLARLGTLRSDIFTPTELEVLRKSKTAQIVDARISDPGPFGHSYFHANPAVSSDLILVMRYHFTPGDEGGRPLRADPKGFWVVDDHYPKSSPAIDALPRYERAAARE